MEKWRIAGQRRMKKKMHKRVEKMDGENGKRLGSWRRRYTGLVRKLSLKATVERVGVSYSWKGMRGGEQPP